jgi:hypothetical protein
MLPKRAVRASLAFVPGKYTDEPNIVLVPADRKTFPVGVEWSMESDESYVIGSHSAEDGHRWCVLDPDLKQVMHGSFSSDHKSHRKAEPVVSRTLHGGGAANPRQINLEMSGAKLKSGVCYTLVATRHGVAAAGEFVAVREPKPKRKKGRAKKKPKAKSKAAKKK